jgi:hypothetical protein
MRPDDCEENTQLPSSILLRGRDFSESVPTMGPVSCPSALALPGQMHNANATLGQVNGPFFFTLSVAALNL